MLYNRSNGNFREIISQRTIMSRKNIIRNLWLVFVCLMSAHAFAQMPDTPSFYMENHPVLKLSKHPSQQDTRSLDTPETGMIILSRLLPTKPPV